MSTKNFCDGCGKEISTYHVRLYGQVTHRTAAGEEVGEDTIRPADMCKTCLEAVQKIIPLTISGLNGISGSYEDRSETGIASLLMTVRDVIDPSM